MLDRLLILGSLSIALTVFVARQMDAFGLNYNPFADLPVPAFTPIGAALAVCCAWPAFVILLLPASASKPVRTVTEEVEPAWR